MKSAGVCAMSTRSAGAQGLSGVRSASAEVGVRAKGFTILELLVVVAIVGVLAGLAVSTLSDLAVQAGAKDDARRVHFALATARTLAHRRNEPVLVELKPSGIELLVPDFPPPPHGFLMTVPGWKVDRTLPLPASVRLVAGGGLEPGGRVAFCPSGEYRFLDGRGDVSPAGLGGPVCPVGDMASRSGRLRMTARGQPFAVEVRAPLSSIELKAGGA